jgi:ABC-type transport system involved in cytochrome c biogenesis permease subunit
MATTELPRYQAQEAALESEGSDFSLKGVLAAAFAPLASLRLTVAQLFLSLILVLAGTLAQIDYDIWHVLHTYFRVWWAWIELKIFFPRSWDVPGAFPYPGGKTIGVLLAINLLAAHALRFRVAASGRRLFGGFLLIGIGALLTYAVIASGANTAIESELSENFVNGLGHALRASIGAAALALAYVLALTYRRSKQSAARWTWWFGAATAAILLSVAVYLFTHPEARLDASGIRILWQLAKATAASVVLGLGCWAVFSKRAGIVLLHSGVGLLMFSELYYAERGVEAQMRIAEGQTVSYAEDMRTSELAITELDGSAKDKVTVIPRSLLVDAYESKKPIELPNLPFAVQVLEYLPNAEPRLRQPGETEVANVGQGLLRTLQSKPQSTGVATEQTFDVPGAYVELVSKEDQSSKGVVLTSPLLNRPDVIEIDGKPYQIALRFKRIEKPYSVKLIDFKFERYEGTETAKNFESVVQFVDPTHNVDSTIPIYMNNPLRYSGDTLYQADWDRATERGTVLQVVTNSGWMIPYVACMIVAAGMLVHFGQAIVRFVGRREDEARRAALKGEGEPAYRRVSLWRDWRRPEVWVPALVLLAGVAVTAKYAAPPKERATDVKIHEFGRLPAAYGGRILPLDTLACNTLRLISGRETYEDERFDKKQPAIRWLLDVVAKTPGAMDHKVIRVENLDVLQAIGLERRKGFRYSVKELHHDMTAEKEGEFRRQAALALAVPKEERNLTQKKFLEAAEKVQRVLMVQRSFDVPDFGESIEDLIQRRAGIERTIAEMKATAPRIVPPATPQESWQTLYESTYNMIREAILSRKQPAEDNATSRWMAMLDAYKDGDAQKFNGSVDDYRDYVGQVAAAEQQHEAQLKAAGNPSNRKAAEQIDLDRVAFEAYFNHFSPFIVCLALYVAAFVLASLAWLGWFEGFNRSANWLLWFTFGLHTFALVCRVMISGRPPVTNLYSSAVFIGWAGVLFALLFEIVYRMGIGNLLAAALGFPTMIIAYYLTTETANNGDTLGVMIAVLDTNFWLATHVICITLGYATTYLAGFLGLATILLGYLGGALNGDQRRQLNRMTYGTLCFAIFFSFIGTVLGGLWADDSWGRFWGWDPKENGALMIVIWNAIVLHARWGKMVGERGLAALAVLGNIVVTWSWFGVNEMGVGLHAYGFTEGRAFWVAMFMLSQLAVVGLAYLTPLVRGAIAADDRAQAA